MSIHSVFRISLCCLSLVAILFVGCNDGHKGAGDHSDSADGQGITDRRKPVAPPNGNSDALDVLLGDKAKKSSGGLVAPY